MKLSRNLATILTVAACAATTLADTTSRYIQDGLLACWDGYENAGAGVHDPSATKWKDLVGGYEFNLTGITVERDRMVFAGTQSSYGELGSTGTAATFDKARSGTLEIVYAPATGTNSQVILQSSTTSGIAIGILNETKIIDGNANAKMIRFTSGTATNGVSIRYNNGTFYSAMVNGSAPTMDNSNNSWGSSSDVTTIGTRTSKKNYPFEGSIYCIRVYSRRLTDAEIVANHAIDVRRFSEGKTDDGDMLTISAEPEELGVPTPDYGLRTGLQAGDTLAVSCPAVWTNEAGTAAATCAGWKLYNGNGNVVSNGGERAFTYVHPATSVPLFLKWQWVREYKIVAAAGAGGSVSFAEQWFADGATCAIAVTPDAGCTFVKWTGDLPDGVDQFDKSPTFTVTGPFSMTAVFAALPDRFVEYVESTNKTTYIDTGIVPNAKATRMFVRLAIAAQTSTLSGVFGSATAASSSANTGSANIYYENKKFRLDWTGSKSDSGITPAVGTVYDIACQYNTVFLAGRRFYAGGTSGNQKKDNNANTLFLFNCNVSGTAYSSGGVLQRLYGCRIWQDGSTLTANLIPCEKNGVAGLYDTVSGAILFPENFPLVASAADNPGVRVNGNAIEARLSISNDDGNGTLASAGSTWTETGTAVSVAPSANDGLQPEYTSTHSGLDYARVYAGPSLSFVMQPWPTEVSVGYSASEYLPHVSDLNEYVQAAPEGATLRLGPGVYTIDKAVSIGKGVTLAGAGRDATIVNQQLGSYGRGISMTSSSASIRDLTVSGFTNCLLGAGIWMSAGTVDTVRVTAGYNYDYNNQGKGVGIHMEGGVVTNSLIDRNSYQTGYGILSAAGVYLNSASASSPALLVDSDIVDNWRNRTEYYGIGVTLEGSNPSRVLRCRITGNWAKIDTTEVRGGCGVYINGASKAVVEECLVASNGVHGVWMSSGTVRNCLIFGHANSSTRESGVFMKGGSLQNNTISANSSTANYPGLRMTAGTAVNNIVYGNTGGAYGLSVSGGTFNTNIVTDLTLVTTSSAIDNSTGNPLMADPSGGDFTIGFDSPAVDSGAPIASVTEDYAGTERPQDGNGDGTAAHDIGAYEYAPSAGGAMEAAIVVADADFRYDGTVTATARVSGGSGDYTYEWYLDGALVADQTTGDFSATGLATGNHTLSLVVSDGEATVTADYAGVITFHPVEVYVSSTGSATFPYDTLETATDSPCDAFAALWLASDTTCTVHVAEGTFTLTSALTIAHPCRILGAGRDVSTLSGAGLPSTHRAMTITSPDAVVRDLTVRDCRNNIEGCGIYMSNGLLENVRSTANESGLGYSGTAPASGVGLYMSGGTATNCLIDGNSQNTGYGNGYGAGVYISSGLLVDCVITNNWRNRTQTYGMGVTATGGTVRRCDIRGNSNKTGGSSETAGMGVNLNGSNALVENCVIQDNGRQGVYLQSGTLRNCLVTGHKTAHSSYAGGVYMTGGKLYNCTVADNKCSTAAYNDLRMTAGTAKNTIATVATVSGGTAANCLLNDDALFRRPESGDYRLTLGSPARDTGDNAVWDGIADPVDLAGNPRIVTRRNGIVDMGCYELQPPAATVLLLW